jgi:hypothetical protein
MFSPKVQGMRLSFRAFQVPELAKRRPWVSWVSLGFIWIGAAIGWTMGVLAAFFLHWQDPNAPNVVPNPATATQQYMLYSTVGVLLGALIGGILAELVVIHQLRQFWRKEIPPEKLDTPEPMR